MVLLTLCDSASKAINSSGARTGLIVGAASPKGYTAFLAIPTPVDTSNPNRDKIDYEWCAEHAHQVTRMLPGGLSILGMFGPTTRDLARMLLAAVSILPKDPVAVTTEKNNLSAFLYPSKSQLQIKTQSEEVPIWTFKCIIPERFVEKAPTFWVVDGHWSSAESSDVSTSELEPGVHTVTFYSEEQYICKSGSIAVCGAFTSILPNTSLGEVVQGLLSDVKRSLTIRQEVLKEEQEEEEDKEDTSDRSNEKLKEHTTIERVLLDGEHNLIFTDYKTQKDTLKDVSDRAECVLGLTNLKATQMEKRRNQQSPKKEVSGDKDPKISHKKMSITIFLISSAICAIGILLYILGSRSK